MAIAKKGTEGKLLSYGQGDTRGPSSFEFMIDMSSWWKVYGPEIAKRFGKCGWILLMLDAHEKLEGLVMTISRLIRNKPEWDTRGWSQQEWTNIENRARAAYGWFATNAPAPEDVPEWGQFILTAMDGLFGAMIKVAQEVREIQEEGHLLVNLTRPETGTIDAEQCALVEG